jgi:hypothetical protein
MKFAAKKRDRAILNQHWIELSTRNTEDGREKLCPHCGEWWPHDETCFGWNPSVGHYRSWCRACEADRTRQYRQRIKHNARPGTNRGHRLDRVESKEAAS